MSNYVILPVEGGGAGTEQRVLIAANLASLPTIGNTEGFIGYAQDTNTYYTWDGAAWVNIATGIDHDQLVNYVANEHIDHTSVSITTSGILSGGGDITATRNIDLQNSDVDHDQTTNFVANEHIDHTSVTLTAGVGLSGGGDISASRTIDLDINELTTAAATQTSDFLAYYDADGLDHNKVLISDLFGQNLTSTSSVTFADVSATIGGIDYSALTQAEVNQLANIDLNTISNTQWGYLGGLDQDVKAGSDVSFNNITASGTVDGRDVSVDGAKLDGIEAGADVTDSTNVLASLVGQNLVVADINTGQGVTEVYLMDQNVRTTDSVTFDGATIGDSTDVAQISMLAGGASTTSASTSVTIPPADDTGAEPIYKIDVRQNDNTDVTSRRLFRLANNGSSRLDIDVDGQMRGQAGSATNPTYSFLSDTNTGMYNSATDTITFVTAGSDRWRVNSAGNLTSVGGSILSADGTESSPSYAFGNDTNTGMYRSAADEISFTNGGVRSWRITSAGDLAPLNNNVIFNSLGSASAPSYSFLGDSNTGVFSSGADILDFTAGGVNTATVTNSAFEVNLSNNSYFFFGTSTTTNTIFSAYSNVGGAFTQKWRVEADGDTISATGSYTSDERAKKDVADIHYGLNEIMQLEPKSFRWLTDEADETKSFCISMAQHIETIMPEMVRDDGITMPGQETPNDVSNGNDNRSRYKSVYEKEIVAVMVKAIQEQQDIINNLETRLEALENS